MLCKHFIIFVLFVFSSSALCADQSVADVLAPTITTVLTPLKNSLVALVNSWFPVLFQIGCAFFIFYLGRLIFVQVKSFANMAALPSGDSDSSGGFLSSEDFEEHLEDDGYYHFDDMIFEDYGDYVDYVSSEEDPEFEVGFREWYENTYG